MLQVTLAAAILNFVSEFCSVTTEFNRDGEFALRGKGKGCGALGESVGPQEGLQGLRASVGPKRVCGASVGPQRVSGALGGGSLGPSERLWALRGAVGAQIGCGALGGSPGPKRGFGALRSALGTQMGCGASDAFPALLSMVLKNMTAAVSDLSNMLRRCLVTLKPFRIFVLGLGFFSLCFLMTSRGPPFTARSE
ncbi:unnamed protein product, partial [Gadus morhua 'NCC']